MRIVIGGIASGSGRTCSGNQAANTRAMRSAMTPTHSVRATISGAAAIAVLEQALADRDYLLGAFSLADVAYAPPLALLVRAGFPLPERVTGWAARIHARPAWRAIARAA